MKDAPPSPAAPDSEGTSNLAPISTNLEDADAPIRLEALKWIHQALADIDRAIETGHTATAKQLLHRIQHVLDMPAIQSDDEH